MADCEFLPKCVFFNGKMAEMPATSNMLKKRYCLGDNSRCARYLVCTSLGKERVPLDLYPNNLERAHQLLEQGK